MGTFRNRVLSALDGIYAFTSARKSVDSVELNHPVQLVQDVSRLATAAVPQGLGGGFPQGYSRFATSALFSIANAGATTGYGAFQILPATFTSGMSGLNAYLDENKHELWMIAQGCRITDATGSPKYYSSLYEICNRGVATFWAHRFAGQWGSFVAMTSGGDPVGIRNTSPPDLELPYRIPWGSIFYDRFDSGAAATAYHYMVFEIRPKLAGNPIP